MHCQKKTCSKCCKFICKACSDLEPSERIYSQEDGEISILPYSEKRVSCRVKYCNGNKGRNICMYCKLIACGPCTSPVCDACGKNPKAES